ncbi:MAG: putative mucin/carbohydrate-binding domain-containing protein [Bacilli bacterium]
MTKKIQIILCTFIIFTSFTSGNKIVNAQTTGSLNIQGLPSRYNTENAQLYRGEKHIREAILYSVVEGTEVTLKQISGLDETDLEVDVLNDDRDHETTYTIPENGDKITFTVDYDSVLFIKVPRGDYNIDVSYEFSDNLSEVPYYTINGNEEDFFAKWDENDNAFAVIENDAIQFLMPLADRDNLRNLKDFSPHNNIDDMLNYYQNMMKTYDHLVGLDADGYVNNNTPSQYFAKADNNGKGLAYYNSSVTAMNAKQFGERFLDVGWVEKHEIAHGYQQNFMMKEETDFDNSINVSEVWNNVFAHYLRVQDTWDNKTIYNSGEETMEDIQYTSKYGFYSGNVWQKLNFFITMFDSFGYEGFRNFNIKYRELANMSPKGIYDHANSEFMALYFSQGAKVNFIPHFEDNNIDISQSIEEDESIRNLSYAQFLNFLVTDETTRNSIVNELGLQADFQMIDTSILRSEELADLNLTNNVEVNINIDDIEEVKNKTVVLKNGEFEVEGEIKNNKVYFKNVPIGVYKVLAPLSENGSYTISKENFLIVSDEKNIDYEIKYNKEENSGNEQVTSEINVYLRGINNYKFAELKTSANNVSITYIEGRAHRYFVDREYARIQILDENETLVYEQIVIGDDWFDYRVDDIEIKENYTLKITGAEIQRSDANHAGSGLDIPTTKGEPLIFKFTPTGTLVNEENILPDVVELGYDSVSDEESQYYRQEKIFELNKIFTALDEPLKSEMIEKYKNVVRSHRPIFENIKPEYEINVQKKKNSLVINEIVSSIKAIDTEDGDISNDITVLNNNIDYNKNGTYDVKLRVRDSDRNANYADLKVIIKGNITDESEGVDVPSDTIDDGNLVKTGIINYAIMVILILIATVSIKKIK